MDYGMLNGLHEAGDALIQPHEGYVVSGGTAEAVRLAKVQGADANA
jgi:predicted class III extradiol MEMO1 family dioxygenase